MNCCYHILCIGLVVAYFMPLPLAIHQPEAVLHIGPCAVAGEQLCVRWRFHCHRYPKEYAPIGKGSHVLFERFQLLAQWQQWFF